MVLSNISSIYRSRMDLLPILIGSSTLISLVFTVFYVSRAQKSTKKILESLQEQLHQGVQDLNDQLDPIIKANSRAMGAISGLADETKMDKALERRIGLDLMSEYSDILDLVKVTFPNVAEYVDDHPEAITKLLPRLNTLISDPEARSRLKLDFSSKSRDLSRIWDEGRA